MELKEVIHSATAHICQDISSADRELRDPPHRRWARLLVIAVVGALLVAAIVVMAVRIPEFQTDKRTFSSKHPTQDLQKLLDDAFTKHDTITCPCQTQVLSWCNMTTFHVYVAADQPQQQPPFQEALNISTTPTNNFTKASPLLCGDDRTDLNVTICQSVLTPVMNEKDSRTFLPTANAFTSPDLLYTEMQIRIDTNAYEAAETYNYLNVNNKTAAFNYSQGLTLLLRNMATQFLHNVSSSSEDFWNASNETRQSYPTAPFAFGMDVNWTMYLQICSPAFCDVQYKVSVLNRLLRSMGQVGGITTVISLALKFLVWPSLRMALRFPTYKAPLITSPA